MLREEEQKYEDRGAGSSCRVAGGQENTLLSPFHKWRKKTKVCFAYLDVLAASSFTPIRHTHTHTHRDKYTQIGRGRRVGREEDRGKECVSNTERK